MVLHDSIIKITPDFKIKNAEHARVLLNNLEIIFKEMNKLTDKGYINVIGINIPIVEALVLKLKNSIKTKNIRLMLSTDLNTLLYNLILILKLRLLIIIEE